MKRPRGAQAAEAHSTYATWTAVARRLRLGVTLAGVVIAGGLLLLLLFSAVPIPSIPSSQTASSQALPPDHVALDIMPVKPGGPADDYAAYVPSTVMTMSANSLVSVTIRNFDLDATPLSADSPYARVQGTVGGVAYADGKAYTALDRSVVAHTFTVPDLHLNVPIPGHATAGKRYVTVTFSVRTGTPGIYAWRCFAPCGDGSDGSAGPMADDAYMRGTLVITS